MKNIILKILNNTWGLLIFSLVSGLAYFAVIYRFILQHTAVGGQLLGLFMLPLIMCGAALVLVKLIKQCLSDGRDSTAVTVFVLHVLFIAVTAATAVAAVIA